MSKKAYQMHDPNNLKLNKQIIIEYIIAEQIFGPTDDRRTNASISINFDETDSEIKLLSTFYISRHFYRESSYYPVISFI